MTDILVTNYNLMPVIAIVIQDLFIRCCPLLHRHCHLS